MFFLLACFENRFAMLSSADLEAVDTLLLKPSFDFVSSIPVVSVQL